MKMSELDLLLGEFEQAADHVQELAKEIRAFFTTKEESKADQLHRAACSVCQQVQSRPYRRDQSDDPGYRGTQTL